MGICCVLELPGSADKTRNFNHMVENDCLSDSKAADFAVIYILWQSYRSQQRNLRECVYVCGAGYGVRWVLFEDRRARNYCYFNQSPSISLKILFDVFYIFSLFKFCQIVISEKFIQLNIFFLTKWTHSPLLSTIAKVPHVISLVLKFVPVTLYFS